MKRHFRLPVVMGLALPSRQLAPVSCPPANVGSNHLGEGGGGGDGELGLHVTGLGSAQSFQVGSARQVPVLGGGGALASLQPCRQPRGPEAVWKPGGPKLQPGLLSAESARPQNPLRGLINHFVSLVCV